MTSISVIIPAYNGRQYIGDAINSVFNQTSLPDELIVVDDASTDGTADYVRSHVGEKPPVQTRVIELDSNSGGPARPINVGVRAARGEFIAVLDQDDVFVPSKLKAESTLLSTYPDIGFVFSLVDLLGEDREKKAIQRMQATVLRHAELHEGSGFLSSRAAIRLLVKWGCFVLGYPGFMFRRIDWVVKGGVNEHVRISSDYDLICWLAARARVGVSAKVGYLRRVHSGNMIHMVDVWKIEGAQIGLRLVDQFGHFWAVQERMKTRQHLLLQLSRGLRNRGDYSSSERIILNGIKEFGPRTTLVQSLFKLYVHRVLHHIRS